MKLSAFFCICLLLGILLCAGNPVSAEIYQYTDESGETHYTNDAASVPSQYRNDVDIHDETVTYDDYYDDYDEDEYDEEGDEGDEEESMEQPEGNLSDVEALKAREAAFENEAGDLKKEYNRLFEARKKVKSSQELAEINAEITELNKRHDDWAQERKAFREEVKAYNEQVRQKMEQKLEAYKAGKSSSDEEL